MKKLVIVLAVILVFVGGVFLWMVNSAQKGLESLVFEDVDMSSVADGTYIGEADAGIVYAKVSVAVKDHDIERVSILEHKNGKGSAAEAITDVMEAENRWDVSVVSGATLSSETIKSAVSKALKAGYAQ